MQENPKITFILGGLVGGGAERVAARLMNHLADEKGYALTLITRLGTDRDRYRISGRIKRIVIGDSGESNNKIEALLKNIPTVWRLRKALKQAGPDVVISFLTKANIHTLLAVIGLKKRVIISERNDTTRENHPQPWPVLRKMLYRYATVVTANSEIALTGMKDYVESARLVHIPNPVEIPEKKADPARSKKILSAGRLVAEKRQDILISAFGKLDYSQREGWSVDILGEGPEEPALKSLIKQCNVSSEVSLHGWTDNPEKFYLNASIFVLSSDYEGTPNALLEALAHGLPSVISDSLPEAGKYVKDGLNGYHFKAGDADDLMRKIEKLIKNPKARETFGQESVKRVSGLSIQKIGERWVELFEKEPGQPSR